ncbi:tRNA (adenosine(37)-N6)-threonylcarbamoyltransferase complex ATPase subunit type 1 TsaE [Streptomyces sp. NPDC005438]|uniref:tRNA (adenosine(37)-N6)-threonylcarbamoyltransferase complex ATPase subunit type 1 TsaE n=1 Tax=Streptomyces sp. NPDC005438 TaxID=3156880 RepID=UPI0033AEEB8E
MDVPQQLAPHLLTVDTADRMRQLGRDLAGLLRPGDLVLLSGELGAGKTTLTRGLGEGLDVRGSVASPTFVIARVHPPLGSGPGLVHVDAYRLEGGLDEMEDLDLELSLPRSVVVVEWGEGKVEGLADSRLEVRIERSAGSALASQAPPEGEEVAEDPRTVRLTAVGPAWHDRSLSPLG